MYPRTVPHAISAQPNLKIPLLDVDRRHHYTRLILMYRQITTNDTFNSFRRYVRDTVQTAIRSNKFYASLKNKIKFRSFKNNSSGILREWAHQCECVAAQRLRRGQQMFCLYSKLWEEHALREIFRNIRQRFAHKGAKEIVFGAVGFSVYDWRKNRITDEEVLKHLDELKYVCKLREKTLCQSCNEKEMKPGCNSRVCKCEDWDQTAKAKATFEDWKLFIEKKDLIVWRRIHKSGCYEYKVYGSYNDVTAEDFLNVQVDTVYRQQWDNTAVQLQVIETDPDKNTHSDILYWEMLWPRLFSNRDYVFHRRFMVEYNSKTVLLLSKSTEHPKCPKYESKYRITDYWSYMVIKPYTELNKVGVEFSLTYYDNPGVNIPASVTAWVAMRAMPEFLERLREAAKKYKKYCKQAGVNCVCNFGDHPVKKLSLNENKSALKWQLCDDQDIITDNTIFEAQYVIKRLPNRRDKPSDPPRALESSDDTNDNSTSDIKSPSENPPEVRPTGGRLENTGYKEETPDIMSTPNVNNVPEPERHHSNSIWRFFRPAYYFS